MMNQSLRNRIATIVMILAAFTAGHYSNAPLKVKDQSIPALTKQYKSTLHGIILDYPERYDVIAENAEGVTFKTADSDSLDGIHVDVENTAAKDIDAWLAEKPKGNTNNAGFELFALTDGGALVKEYYIYEQNPETKLPVFASRLWGMKLMGDKAYLILIDRDLLGSHVPRLNSEAMSMLETLKAI